MKKLFLLLLLIPLVACGPTKNALIAEQSYYQAKVDMARKASAMPLMEILAGDKEKPMVFYNVASIRVYQPPQGGMSDGLTQYQQRDYSTPWIQAFLQSLGILAPWAGAAVIVGQVAGHVAGPVTNTNVTASGGSQAMTGGVMSNATSVPTVVVVQPSYPPAP